MGSRPQRLGRTVMRYQWLLFDVDGTLFDYDKAEKTALMATFASFSLSYVENTLEVYREINDELWRAFEDGEITQEKLKIERFRRLLVSVGVNEDMLPEAFSRRYLQNLGDCTYLIDGAESVLASLFDKVHLALITNGLQQVQRSRLAQSTIGHYFEAILISEELGVAKPHPGIFDAAFAAMGYPDKAHVLIIGDSLSSDIQGGRDYGIHTCWYNPQGKPRDTTDRIDYEIQDLTQILEIIQTLPL
jgi:2-haloacid dehalogenase